MFIALLFRLLLCTPLAALLRPGCAPWAFASASARAIVDTGADTPHRHTVQSSRARQRQRPLRRLRGREPPGVDPPATPTAAND